MANELPTVGRGAHASRGPASQAERPDLRTIVMWHHEAIYRYAFRLAGNQADAEDLVQQTFLVAQQEIDRVRETDKILRWLYAVLRNCFLKSCRSKRPVLIANLDLDIEQVAEAPKRDDVDEAAIQLALDDLPEEFRIVVLMFYFEDCSYKEIAAQLEIPIGTVMSRLARAKAHLRRWLISREELSAANCPPADCRRDESPKAGGQRTCNRVGQ